MSEKNIYDQFIDRGGAAWYLSEAPQIQIIGQARDMTAALGFTTPNIWSEGGIQEKIILTFEVFTPTGTKPPKIEELAEKLINMLRNQ